MVVLSFLFSIISLLLNISIGIYVYLNNKYNKSLLSHRNEIKLISNSVNEHKDNIKQNYQECLKQINDQTDTINKIIESLRT